MVSCFGIILVYHLLYVLYEVIKGIYQWYQERRKKAKVEAENEENKPCLDENNNSSVNNLPKIRNKI